MKHNKQGQEPHRLMTSTSNKYRSKFESRIAANLTKKNVPFTYETKSYGYTLTKTYTPDIFLGNGTVIELKGQLREKDKLCLRAIKAQHPSLDLRICFQNAAVRLTKKKNSMTYGEWATRHGFKWSSGTIPPDWYG